MREILRRTPGAARRALFVAVAVVAVLTVAIAANLAEAATGCKKVSGKFTLTPLIGPECTSSVGVCTTGVSTGGLTGTTAFTGTSLTQTVDTPTTGVVLLTGDSMFTLKDGTLQTKDAVVLRTTGAGEFAEIDTVIGGTEGWAGSTGVLNAQGTFTATSGGSGSYTGEVCQP